MIIIDSSQNHICSVPVRMDTYNHCTFGCTYCFANEFRDHQPNLSGEIEKKINLSSNPDRLIKRLPYLEGTPIHWGGMSDGFQPIEEIKRNSLKLMEHYNKIKYPIIISTKSTLLAEEPYFSLLKEGNYAIQVSIFGKSCELYDKGAPKYSERVEFIQKISSYVPVIVRVQPYIVKFHNEVLEMIQELKEVGIKGITVEGIKRKEATKGFLRKSLSEYVYHPSFLFPYFRELREKCHQVGIQFFAAENLLRFMGDSLNCCGFEDIRGFENSNTLNILQLFQYKEITFSNLPKIKGIGGQGFTQTTVKNRVIQSLNKESEYGFYNFLRWYVNHGFFKQEYLLKIVGEDSQDNYIFECSDPEIEEYRKSLI